MNRRPSTPTALRLAVSLLLLAGIVQAAPSRAAPLHTPTVPPSAVSIAGPAEGGAGAAYTFTATVTPGNATVPLTYVWEASGLDPVTHADVPSLTDEAAFTWPSCARRW